MVTDVMGAFVVVYFIPSCTKAQGYRSPTPIATPGVTVATESNITFLFLLPNLDWEVRIL